MIDKKIAVAIMNYDGISVKYNGVPILKLTLDSLIKTKYKNMDIYVSDDLSNDKSLEFIKKNYLNINIIEAKEHGYYIGASNNALKFLLKKNKYEYILIMNNDMIIKDYFWLEKMIKLMEKDKSIGVQGCQLIYPDGKIQWAGMSLGKFKLLPYIIGHGEEQKKEYDSVNEVDAASCIFLARTQIYKELGIYDKNFIMGGEETDFCIRAKEKGYKIIYNGNVKIIHLESFTITQHKNPKFIEKSKYFGMVGYVYFLRKNFSFPKQLFGIIIFIGKSIFSLNQRGTKRGILYLKLQKKPFRGFILALKAIKDAYSRKVIAKNRLLR